MTKKQLKIVQKYVEELKEVSNKFGSDPECAHSYAEDAILDALDELGFSELVEAYGQVVEDCGGFWYA